MRISDRSSDVCSSDLAGQHHAVHLGAAVAAGKELDARGGHAVVFEQIAQRRHLQGRTRRERTEAAAIERGQHGVAGAAGSTDAVELGGTTGGVLTVCVAAGWEAWQMVW